MARECFSQRAFENLKTLKEAYVNREFIKECKEIPWKHTFRKDSRPPRNWKITGRLHLFSLSLYAHLIFICRPSFWSAHLLAGSYHGHLPIDSFPEFKWSSISTPHINLLNLCISIPHGRVNITELAWIKWLSSLILWWGIGARKITEGEISGLDNLFKEMGMGDRFEYRWKDARSVCTLDQLGYTSKSCFHSKTMWLTFQWS